MIGILSAIVKFATRRIGPVTARTLCLIASPPLAEEVRSVEKEARTLPWRGTIQREREEAPGGAREQQRTRPRVITSPVGAELSPPTRGAHRAPIGRAPCRGNVPASRRGFSFVLAHLRTSLDTLLSSFLSLSLSFLPIVYHSCHDMIHLSLFSFRYAGFYLCLSRRSL